MTLIGARTTDYALLDDAFANLKPVLAICYGAQILNVRLGGTLYQDIESELPGSLNHTKEGIAKGAPNPVHDATIVPGGELGQIAAATGAGTVGRWILGAREYFASPIDYAISGTDYAWRRVLQTE